jgi:hypothetical protein
MSDDSYVQEIRYTADITDVQAKMNKLAGDTDGVESNTRTNAGKMSKSWEGVGDSVKKIGVGLGLLGVAAIAAAPRVLEAGAGLIGLDEKAKTVFEGSIGSVNAWASANAAAMGLTASQARDGAAAMADLLKPMGFTSDEAATMSTSMLDLSGALSAWTGGTRTAAEVSEILSKAMLGDRDGLKELGISISEADVAARLAKNGTSELTGAALEQAKAVATQQLILEKSTDAQTAWGDGSMDAAKKQNAMKASTAQLGESVTRALYPALEAILPVVTSVATWLGERAPAAIEVLRNAIGDVANWFSENKAVMIATAVGLGAVLVGLFTAWAVGATTAAVATLAAAAPFIAIGAAVAAVAAAVVYAYENWEGFRVAVTVVKNFILDELVPAFQQIWAFISEKLIPIVRTVAEVYFKALVAYFNVVRSAIMDYLLPAFIDIGTTMFNAGAKVAEVVGNIVGFITALPGRIFGTIYGLWDGLRTGITEAKDWVGDRIDEVVGFATGLPGRMAGLFSGMWDGIKNAFRSALNWIIDKWNGLSFEIPSVSAFGVTLGGGTVSTPNIPRLATGGLAFAPTMAIVGDNRNARTDPEVIAPLSQLVAMLRQELTPEQPSTFGSGPITLIIEGHPFRAILADAETERRRVA